MSRAAVRLGATINLGDYQNIRVEVELGEDGQPGESAALVHDRVLSQALEAVDDALGQLIMKLEDERWIPKT